MSDEIAVVVGGGRAAAEAAIGLRQEGYGGRVILIGDEPVPPYARPPLCKAYLAGQEPAEKLLIRSRDHYRQANIELRLGVAVTRLRIADRSIDLDDGTSLAYDQLVLATGGRARRLGIPGAEHPRLHYLRSLAQADAIRRALKPGMRLLLIGGGTIGLEVAAVARRLGAAVTILEAMPQLLARVTGALVGEFYRDLHSRNGVEIQCGTAAVAISGGADHVEVLASDERRHQAELAIVAIGQEPDIELAQDAGIVCNHGIVVDEFCRSSVPGIYAAGDCTEHSSAIYDTQLRLQSVSNAIEQGRTVAATICGKSRPYRQVPWFWSEQYDIRLQSAGLSRGHDRSVLRGDPASGSFAVFYLRGERLLAVDAIDRPVEFSLARAWIAERLPVSPLRLADEAIAPQQLAA